MRWVKAVAALAAVLVVTAAPPVLLVAFLGNPVPDTAALEGQLTDHATVRLVSAVVWLLWAQTVGCIAAETVATLRSQHLARVPGTFGIQQQLARLAIGAIVAATVALPTVGATTAAFAKPDTTPRSSTTPPSPNTGPARGAGPATDLDTQVEDRAEEPGRPVAVTVLRGDTLWAIAEARLGNGERWAEIAALNDGRTMNDGRTFVSASTIRPGWKILVPADAVPDETRRGQAGHDYIVRPGDTLSEIAADRTGDANQWPALFEASQQLDQSQPLTDPDLIHPGQHILIPAETTVGSDGNPPDVDGQRRTEPAAENAKPPVRSVAPPAPRSVEGVGTQSDDQDLADQAPATTDDEVADEEGRDNIMPGWVAPGLAGAGTLLAGSLLITLRARRSAQRRHRRPGRTIPSTDPRWTSTEKSVAVAGATTTSTIDLLDTLLKQTAVSLVDHGQPLPQVAAVEVTDTAVALHLHSPDHSAPDPWAATDDGLLWVSDRPENSPNPDSDLDEAPAPWPLLVTIGHDDRDSTWLLNLEDQTVAVTGGTEECRDLARFVAAELALNPWSRHTQLDLVGVADELAPIDSNRIRCHTCLTVPAAVAVADAVTTIDRLVPYSTDTPTARARATDPDPWPSRVLISDGHDAPDELGQIHRLTTDHYGSTGTGLLLLGDDEGLVTPSLEIDIDLDGRLTIPAVNLTVSAVGLTSTEAQGCAALLAQADQLDDKAPDDLHGDEPWHRFATTTGSLRGEYRTDRDTPPSGQSTSILPAGDEEYVTAAATTVDDLAALAPQVEESVAVRVADADSTLDQDLADWHAASCTRPRLALLGPVSARATGNAIDRRKPFYTELFAYLATRPNGATTDEVATAFDITPQRVRVDINRLRDWLGIDPRSGDRYLPEARNAPAAQTRGIGVYQIVGGIVDIDLFRRLRLRAETRGPDGIDDLKRALELVSGRPFDQLRPAGWGWLFEGDRLDHHLTSAIVDTAHLIVAQSLVEGNAVAAREAVTTALAAAPDEDIANLDLVAVCEAEGDSARAYQLVKENLANKPEQGEAPAELPARSELIIEAHRWLSRDVV